MKIVKVMCILIVLLLAWIIGCEKLPQAPGPPFNLMDPNSPNYVLPQVEILSGPEDGETVVSDSIVFTCQGNLANMEFRYKLDDSGWSDYENRETITLTALDDELHQFDLQARYLTGVESEIVSRNFMVNAIFGPALVLYHKKMVIDTAASFDLELRVDETDSIAFLTAGIQFDNSKLQVTDISYFTGSESFLLNNGGQLVTFSSSVTDANSAGIIQLDAAVVEGNPHNVMGSGKIARFSFQHISGDTTQISISDESWLRNSNNVNAPLNNLVHSLIIVQ